MVLADSLGSIAVSEQYGLRVAIRIPVELPGFVLRPFQREIGDLGSDDLVIGCHAEDIHVAHGSPNRRQRIFQPRQSMIAGSGFAQVLETHDLLQIRRQTAQHLLEPPPPT